jgi:hypothetical protein
MNLSLKSSAAASKKKQRLGPSLLGGNEGEDDDGKGHVDGNTASEVTTFGGDAREDNFSHVESNANELVIPVPAPRNTSQSGEETVQQEQLSSSSSSLSSSSSSKKRLPLLMANIPPELLGKGLDDGKKFKLDMSLRPADIAASSSAYEFVPVGQFGAAMLRGMGWVGPTPEQEAGNEGDKNNNNKARPTTVLGMGEVNRERRLGLGATAKPKKKNSNKNKSDDTGAAAEPWRQRANEKMASQIVKSGDVVLVRNGELAGRRARVAATAGVPGLDRIRVSMETDGAAVELGRREVALVPPEALAKAPFCDAEVPAAAAEDQKQSSSNKRPREGGEGPNGTGTGTGEVSSKKPKSDKAAAAAAVPAAAAWLVAGIRVRIISKTAGSDSATACYLKKGDVLDMYERGVASVRLDSGDVVEGVRQQHLETVLPSVGNDCLVLRGAFQGQRARLLEKNKQQETVVVELQEDLDVVSLSMDDIAAVANE